MGFFDNYEKDVADTYGFFDRMLNPKFYEVFEKIGKLSKEFYDNGGAIIMCECPTCGTELHVDLWDKSSNKVIEKGVYLCNKCDHYFELQTVGTREDARVLVRPYHHYEFIDIYKEIDEYLSENISVDDWKIIFANMDMNKDTSGTLKNIKAILESKGVVFDEEDKNDAE